MTDAISGFFNPQLQPYSYGDTATTGAADTFQNLLNDLEARDAGSTPTRVSKRPKGLKMAPAGIIQHKPPATLEEAGRQMEVQLVTLMFKAMEKSSTENGLLGDANQGMGYFKDQFFQSVAEQMVDAKGLGFREALKNNYETKYLG